MKILITTFTFPPETNGVSQVCYKHAMMLYGYGHDITIATNTCVNRNKEDYPFDIQEFNVTGNANLRSKYKGEITKYIDFISNYVCDIILCHAWQIWSTDLAIRAFKNNPAKKIIISHGISANNTIGFPRTFLSWLLWRPYIFLLPKYIACFDHLIFLSDKTDRNRFYDFYIVKKMRYENYSIIPNGVDLLYNEFSGLEEFREIYNIPKDSFMILNVSNYSPYKNQLFVLKSFLQSDIKNATLVFIGSNKNSYSEKLQKYNTTHNKSIDSKNVLFLSEISRNDVLAAYKAADLFCFASKTEYFPLVIIESMISKTPWISTNIGCVSALAGGVVVNSMAEMSELIIRLSSDKKLYDILKTSGYIFAEENLQWRLIGERLNNLLLKISNE